MRELADIRYPDADCIRRAGQSVDPLRLVVDRNALDLLRKLATEKTAIESVVAIDAARETEIRLHPTTASFAKRPPEFRFIRESDDGADAATANLTILVPMLAGFCPRRTHAFARSFRIYWTGYSSTISSPTCRMIF